MDDEDEKQKAQKQKRKRAPADLELEVGKDRESQIGEKEKDGVRAVAESAEHEVKDLHAQHPEQPSRGDQTQHDDKGNDEKNDAECLFCRE